MRERSNNGSSTRPPAWCNGCHLRFVSAEPRVTKGGKEYHSQCVKKVQRERNAQVHLEVMAGTETVELKDALILDERYLERMYGGDFDL